LFCFWFVCDDNASPPSCGCRVLLPFVFQFCNVAIRHNSAKCCLKTKKNKFNHPSILLAIYCNLGIFLTLKLHTTGNQKSQETMGGHFLQFWAKKKTQNAKK
jgi:hypothetical protein